LDFEAASQLAKLGNAFFFQLGDCHEFFEYFFRLILREGMLQEGRFVAGLRSENALEEGV
jgi:hypothetical protein